MKKIYIAMALVGALAVPAKAADIVRRAAPAPAMAEPVYNWTGFYIGGHVGAAWDKSNWTFPENGFWNNAPGEHLNFDPTSWLAGAQVGFNYQISNFVIGIEGTWSGSGLKQTVVSPFHPSTDLMTTEVKTLYTVAGRAGVVFGQYLFYGKGGWAGGRVDLSATSGAVFWNPHAQNRNGWVAGAGAEYMLTPNLILGVEYDHIDLGSATYSANNTGGNLGPNVASDRSKIDSVVGRLSYKFGGPMAPAAIATRY